MNGGDSWHFKLWKEKFQIGDDVLAHVNLSRRFYGWAEGQVIGHSPGGYPIVRCGDRVEVCGSKHVKHLFQVAR